MIAEIERVLTGASTQFLRRRLIFLSLITITLSALVVVSWSLQRRASVPDLDDETLWKRLQIEFASEPRSSVPAPTSAAVSELGEQLFHDRRLSKSDAVSCATCHQPSLAFTDQARVATALASGVRNTPTLFFAAQQQWYFWDGRADNLAAQALGPLENPKEHGTNRLAIARIISTHYRDAFTSAFSYDPFIELDFADALPRPKPQAFAPLVAGFGVSTIPSTLIAMKFMNEARAAGPIRYFSAKVFQSSTSPHPDEWYSTWDSMNEEQKQHIDKVFYLVGIALASFQLQLDPPKTTFDRLLEEVDRGTPSPSKAASLLSIDEWNGAKIFYGKGQCVSCHSGRQLSNGQFHNTGLPHPTSVFDSGRAEGLVKLQSSELRCDHPLLNQYLPGHDQSPSCQEKPYLYIDNIEQVGAFKTPTLRQVAYTPPYMHDGQFADLEAVIDFYNDLPTSGSLGHREATLRPLKLNASERRALLAFLKTL